MSRLKKIVIGSGGFIGSHLMPLMPDAVGIDLKDGNNFCDWENVRKCQNADVIILLAAKHLEQTQEMYNHNLKIYEALTRLHEPHVIFISSAAVYGESLIPHTEEEDLRPSTLYGQSKALGERIVQDVFGDWTILRLSNVFGDGDGHGVIDVFKRGGQMIYGDPNNTRDFVHVDVVAKAVAAVSQEYGRYNKRIMNISSGVGKTVREVFEQHGKGKPIYVNARKTDVAYSVLSNDLATIEGLI